MFSSDIYDILYSGMLIQHGADKEILDIRGLYVTVLAAQQGNQEAIAIREGFSESLRQ